MAFTSPSGRSYNDDSDLEGQLLAQGYSGPRDHASMHAAWLNAEPGGAPTNPNDPGGLFNYDAANLLGNNGLTQAKLAQDKARQDTIDKPGMDSLIAYRKAQSDLESSKLQWLKDQQQKNWDITNEKDAVRNSIDIWQQQGRQANEFGQGTGLYAAPTEQPDLPNRYKMDQYVRDFMYRYPGQQPDNAILDQLFPMRLPPGVTMTPGQVAPPHGSVPAAATPGTPAPTPAAPTPAAPTPAAPTPATTPTPAAADPYAKWQPPDNFMGDKIPGWTPPKEWNWPPDWPDRVARWRRGEPLSPPAAAAQTTAPAATASSTATGQTQAPAASAAGHGNMSASGMPDLPENQPNGGQTMPLLGLGTNYDQSRQYQVGSNQPTGTGWQQAFNSNSSGSSGSQASGMSAQGGQSQGGYGAQGGQRMQAGGSAGIPGGQNSYGSGGYGAQGGYNTQPSPSRGGYGSPPAPPKGSLGSSGGPNPYTGIAPVSWDPIAQSWGNTDPVQQQQDLAAWTAKNNWEQQQATLLGRFNGQETIGGRAQTMAEQQAQHTQEYQAAMMRANPQNYAVTAALAGNPAWGGGASQASQGGQGGMSAQGGQSQGGYGAQGGQSQGGGRPPWQQGILGSQGQGQEQSQNSLGVPNPRQMSALQYQRMRPDEQQAFGSAVKSTGRSLEDWQNENARYQPNQGATMQTARWR